MIDVYVLNKKFEIIDVCDDYASLIWTTRYFTFGDFELYVPATEKNINLFKKDLYCVRDFDVSEDKFKNVMVIEKIQITTSAEDGNYIIVTGRCLKSLLCRRIVWSQTTLSGNVEVAIRKVVSENAINPTNESRKIDNLTLGVLQGFSDTFRRQVTGVNLEEFIKDVCTTYGWGWDIYISNGSLIFELYKGFDRSYNQSTNPYVVFSPEFDNLLTTNYEYDKTNYKNVALVAGEGEGTARKIVEVGTASGLDRYEIYIDSRNSSSNDGEITSDEYNALLIEEGVEELSSDQNSIVESMDGEIESSTNYEFGEDYFLGDIVQVINEYGISASSRIIEIIESDDETGTSTIPTFSTWEV